MLGITRWGSRGRIQRNGSENANGSRSHLQSGMGIILIRWGGGIPCDPRRLVVYVGAHKFSVSHFYNLAEPYMNNVM